MSALTSEFDDTDICRNNKDRADIWADKYVAKVLEKHPALRRFTGKDAIKKKIKDLEQKHKVLLEGSRKSGAGRHPDLDSVLHLALEVFFNANPLVNPQHILDTGRSHAATTYAANGSRTPAAPAAIAAVESLDSGSDTWPFISMEAAFSSQPISSSREA
ncbi:TPA: hypothetical protein ACH3X1_012232 [Trebouxia sp. C0004]